VNSTLYETFFSMLVFILINIQILSSTTVKSAFNERFIVRLHQERHRGSRQPGTRQQRSPQRFHAAGFLTTGQIRDFRSRKRSGEYPAR